MAAADYRRFELVAALKLLPSGNETMSETGKPSKHTSKVPVKTIDPSQKKLLGELALQLIDAFGKGVVMEDDPEPHVFGDLGGTMFDQFTVRFNQEFLDARSEFVSRAAKALKAKAAHEPTIRNACLAHARGFVIAVHNEEKNEKPALELAAASLVAEVVAEANKSYRQIEANFLIGYAGFSGVLTIGRVQVMPTTTAIDDPALAKMSKLTLIPGEYPSLIFAGDTMAVGMPQMVWMVDVPATKENVGEEAKWLVDVAVSFMRLASRKWLPHIYPGIGEIEPHPIRETLQVTPHVTLEDDSAYAGGGKANSNYGVTQEVGDELQSPENKKKAELLFDPPAGSLALRFAQGLGWLSRGRQAFDRAERLLAFFTALEALLTSNDKSDPVVQTISRFSSIIYTQDLKGRVSVYNRIKSLYGSRSAVVHGGRREVLWEEVNTLQFLVEAVFYSVLVSCDLAISQDKFSQSLLDASHGLPWEFAKT